MNLDIFSKNIGIKISFQKVSNILANPVYAGIIKTKLFNEPIKGLHKPIISEAEFFKIQESLNKNTKKFYKPTLAKDFPLTRFLKCPYCNSNLKGSWSKGRSKKYPYYHCTKKGCEFKPIRILTNKLLKENEMPLSVSILNIYGYEVENITGRNPVIIEAKYT
ncbi:MAG: recombinase family protein, partial [Actinobacteria bacterium]|nr:recombinase family protein [Actinomycetota bacterium]